MENKLQSINSSVHKTLGVAEFLCGTLFYSLDKVFIQQVENDLWHVTVRLSLQRGIMASCAKYTDLVNKTPL